MAHKGVKMIDISGAHAQIVFGNVLGHFIPSGQFLALPGAKIAVFKVKTPLPWGVPKEGLIAPKVVKRAF